MNKLSSFLVFLIGIVLLVVVGVMMVQRIMPVKKKSPADLVLPQSDLPPLIIESTETFQGRLDTLFKDGGGITAISNFVEREFVPGRTLVLAATSKLEPSREFIILDRELRRCDGDGVTILSMPPVMPRSSATLRMDERSAIHTWSRLRVDTPFILTAWCAKKGR